MSIEEKGKRSLANAQASVENENQKHSYCEDESAGHLTAEFEHKGEDPAREEGTSKVTAGRHIKSGKNGLEVAKERSAHVESNRKASAAIFDSKKLTVCPEQKGRKRK
jgi:hypothetical protein